MSNKEPHWNNSKGPMKKICIPIVVAFLIAASTVWAQDGEAEFLYGFLQGTYQLIGKRSDSNETYAGKIHLKKKGDYLKVLRIVNGEESEGEGRIEMETADKIKVLRVRFRQREREYEATYLIHSDLGNYARLTGRLYSKTGDRTKPALEALFFKHSP